MVAVYLVYGRSWYDEEMHRRLLEEGDYGVEVGGQAEHLFPVIKY